MKQTMYIVCLWCIISAVYMFRCTLVKLYKFCPYVWQIWETVRSLHRNCAEFNSNRYFWKDSFMKFILVVLTGVMLCQACGSDERKSEPPVRTKTADVSPKLTAAQKTNIQNAKELADLFTPVKTIHLETVNESLIGKIESFHFDEEENRFVALANNGVFVFDSAGKFRNRIGGKGQGPQEYNKLRSMAAYDNTVAIFSIFPAKLLFFKVDGTFIKEIIFDSKKWLFHARGMVFNGKDLYMYPKNTARRQAPDGNEYQVFRLKNGSDFDRAFGKPEKTLAWGDGAIGTYQNFVIFAGVFDGNLYQIDTRTDELSVLCALGELFDSDKVEMDTNSSEGLLAAFKKYFKGMDAILQIGITERLILLHRHRQTAIIDYSGEILNRDASSKIELGDDFDGFASHKNFFSYSKGIMIVANLKSRTSDVGLPNPSVIFYELTL